MRLEEAYHTTIRPRQRRGFKGGGQFSGMMSIIVDYLYLSAFGQSQRTQLLKTPAYAGVFLSGWWSQRWMTA